MATPTRPVLQVQGLTIDIRSPYGMVRAADGLDYEVRQGEVLGVVGESGSGKTVSALSLLGLLPRPATDTVSGTITLDGREISSLHRRDLRRIRGREISFIFQDPLTSLDPVFTVERQVCDAIRAHDGGPARRARPRAHSLLTAAGVPDAARRARQYPHQWSGGMRQRALIAMALAHRTRLIVADEPTSALDVTIQAQVLDTLRTVQRESGTAMLMISHDLAQVAGIADRVLVMYAGRIVESGPVEKILTAPTHPYTRGLVASSPRIADGRHRLAPIPGSPPSMVGTVRGCSFEPRCGVSAGRSPCTEDRPPLRTTAPDGSAVACHYHDEPPGPSPTSLDLPRRRAREGGTGAMTPNDVVLRTRNLSKSFLLPRDGLRTRRRVQAVDDVSLELRPGSSLGLVGESGCGKSTLAWLLAGLIQPDSGTIEVDGRDVTQLDRSAMKAVRRHLQIVFQDPTASLDPRMSVADVVREPLAIHGIGTERDQRHRVSGLLDLVGLDRRHASRFPHELSGGQRQRVALARALALETRVLILDEPVSALDVSIQAQIVTLLQDLQAELDLHLLFISHDLAVVHALADDVAVMYAGRIVETGTREEVFHQPRHPYTRALLEAIPDIDRSRPSDRPRIVLDNEADPTMGGSGCRFHPRCWKSQEVCEVVTPAPVVPGDPTTTCACHFPEAPTT